MSYKKRIPLYLLGLFIMMLGITLLNRVNFGTTPLSSIPLALSRITAGTPLTYGVVTLLFHAACILLQIIITRKASAPILLQIPLAGIFSVIMDFLMNLIRLDGAPLWLRILLGGVSISFLALGVVIVVGVDLILPAPDALFNTISRHFNIDLPKVKIVGDISFVVTSLTIAMVYLGSTKGGGFFPLLMESISGTFAIGIGTLVAMYMTGYLVGVFRRFIRFPSMQKPVQTK